MTSSTLCLDFGNTRLKAALFDGSALQSTHILPREEDLESLLRELKPANSILSSVVHHAPETEGMLAAHSRFHKLSHQSRLPFTIPVGKPETMGADRMALAAAAVALHGGTHILAVALGTCITYNYIDHRRQFLGGSISPGLSMRLRAMHEYTALLPLVPPDPHAPLIGYDTATHLQSGAVRGLAAEVDGMVAQYRERFGKFNALLTGGDAGTIAPHLKSGIFADPELIFKGLYAIAVENLPA